MKNWIVFASLFLIMPLGLIGQEIEDEVDLIHRQKFEWMINKELTLLQEILDDQLLYVHSNGWRETSNEVVENIASGKLEYKAVEIASSVVRYFNDIAIVNGRGTFHVALDGKPLEIVLDYTEVYRRELNRWVLVTRHAARL
jgi:hypothetical protein